MGVVKDMVVTTMDGQEFEKPEAEFIGANGNVFNLMGIANKALKRAGLGELVKPMIDRVTECGSYDEALLVMGEYVDIV